MASVASHQGGVDNMGCGGSTAAGSTDDGGVKPVAKGSEQGMAKPGAAAAAEGKTASAANGKTASAANGKAAGGGGGGGDRASNSRNAVKAIPSLKHRELDPMGSLPPSGTKGRSAAARLSPSPMTAVTLNSNPGPKTDVTARGVSLRFLQQLVDTGGAEAFWTIEQTVERYVRPKTQAHRCSLFDLLPGAYCGQPRFLVCATPSQTLGDLLTLLGSFIQASSPTDDAMLWLPFACLGADEPQGPMLESGDLGRLLQSTEATVFCLDEQCASLADMWCLFTVWHTFFAKGPAGLRMLLPQIDAAKLKEAFKSMDLPNATAPVQQDQQRMLGLMTGNGSVAAEQVHIQIKEAVVGGACYEAEHNTLEGLPWAMILAKASELALANGRYMEAEILGDQAYKVRLDKLGADHPDTMRCVYICAACLTDQGRHGEAEPFYRKIYESKLKTQGPDDLDTIAWQYSLCVNIDRQGRRHDAEPLYRAVLQQRIKVQGPDHPESLSCLTNLASCTKALAADGAGNRLAAAEALFKQALEAYTRVMGADHPETVHAYNNLAICLDDQGRREEAEPMFFKVLEARQRLVGPDHPTTADAMYNLAQLMEAEGEYDEALRMYENAKQVYLKAYGPNHAETEDAASRAAAMAELIGVELERASANAAA